MDKIDSIEIEPLSDSKYVTPYRMNYKQNGVAKTWEALKEHESVCILIYNKSQDCFVFVSQFRPAVYLSAVRHAGGDTKVVDTDKYPGKLGVTYELCAGIVDKDVSAAEIAKMEVLEECGYDVPVESLEVISCYRTGVGTSGSYQSMYYVEVTDEQKRTAGGGIDDEYIELVTVPREEAISALVDGEHPRPMTIGVKYAVLWFSVKKNSQYARTPSIETE